MADFFEFLRKTNALSLAVGIIIGAPIGKVVSSVVGDLLMPVVSLFVGGEGTTFACPDVDYPRKGDSR